MTDEDNDFITYVAIYGNGNQLCTVLHTLSLAAALSIDTKFMMELVALQVDCCMDGQPAIYHCVYHAAL